MKRRNQFLTVILVVLCGTSTILFVNSRRGPVLKIDAGLFKVEASQKIDQVTLQRGDRKINLDFENGKWRVNNNWDADASMIKVLFATASQVEPRRPVAVTLIDSVKHELQKNGVHVIMSEHGTVKTGFTAGGNSLKTEAWFLKDGDTQPYVMTIPGYRVYVSGIFELDESGWRNKRVFDFNWRNFRSLATSYPKEKDQSFEIELKGRELAIRGIELADTAKLADYVDAISLLFATKFISSPDHKVDSLKLAVPAAEIVITDIGKSTYSLGLFPPSKNDQQVYGRLGNGEVVALDKNDVARIVRRKDYFRVRPPR